MGNRLILIPILLSVFVLFLSSCCKDKDATNIEPLEVESYMTLRLDDLAFDTLRFNCSDTYTKTINNVIKVDNGTENFIVRQGYEYELENNVSLKCLVYIFDATVRFQLYTLEIMADYINNKSSNVLLDIEINKDNITYRNQWFDDWRFIANLINREITDENAEYNIITNEPIRPLCTDNLPLLPLDINYTGVLKSSNGLDSIQINSMVSRFYLSELF